MMKTYTLKGKTIKDLQLMSDGELAKLLNSRQRRSLKRGFSEQKKIFFNKIKKAKPQGFKKPIKTHLRDMMVLPEMLGCKLLVHNGKEFMAVTIEQEMIGHYLGEFSMTRKKVKHSAPGIGATKSSGAVTAK